MGNGKKDSEGSRDSLGFNWAQQQLDAGCFHRSGGWGGSTQGYRLLDTSLSKGASAAGPGGTHIAPFSALLCDPTLDKGAGAQHPPGTCMP